LYKENLSTLAVYNIAVKLDEDQKRKIINSEGFINTLFESPYHKVLCKVLKQLEISKFDYSLMVNFSNESISRIDSGIGRMKKLEKLTFFSNSLKGFNEEFPGEYRVYFQLLQRLMKCNYDSLLNNT
jgi:hypothetical protein